MSAPASSRFPLVRIERDDNFADERATSSYALRADGSLEIEHVMSNGGADATVTTCSGRIPPADAAPWVDRVRQEATLAAPPRGPSREETFAKKIQYRYKLGYETAPKSVTYADPAPWLRDVELLVERLERNGRCTRSTRAD